MTIYQTIYPSERFHIGREIAVLILATLLLTLSAKISIPFYPIPMTMQTFVVVGLGLTLGSSRGAAAILLYLAEGALGLPVFAGTPNEGIGMVYMLSKTGGYLIGFIFAAYIAGLCAEKGWTKSYLNAFGVALLSTAVIFIPGVLWLGATLGWDKPIVSWGLTPFIFGAIFKSILAAIVFPVIWKKISK